MFSAINRLTQSNALRLVYQDQSLGIAELSAEYLRVFSPSAEVRGHGNAVLQFGKAEVQLAQVKSVGFYGIQLTFSDGHDSGIYTWEYLHSLHKNQSDNWQDYLKNLHSAHKSRFANHQVVQIQSPPIS